MNKPLFDELFDALKAAREKHPDPEYLFEALIKKIGELARSKDPFAPGNIEALHVAVVTMRIFTEGTTPVGPDQTDDRPSPCELGPTETTFRHLGSLGRAAHRLLTRLGVKE